MESGRERCGDEHRKNDEYHLVSINGGMEEQYGLDLLLDDDTYRTMTFDDYPVYYEMGEKDAAAGRRCGAEGQLC